MVIFRIFVKTCGVRLQKRGHLVNKGAGASGTDAVHALLCISVLEINNFGVLTAKLNGNVRLGCFRFQSCGHGHHLLDEGKSQMLG